MGSPEVRAWAEDQRVFVSSVMAGMEKERTAVAGAVEQLGAVPVWFENFGGRDDDPEAAYLAEVAGSDIYVGVLGERYGKPLASGYSATHTEYREAVRRGLRVSVWAHQGPFSGPQRDFLDEVRVFRTTGTFSDADDLASRVAARLKVLAAEDTSPWVKVGNSIFRARRVVDDGTAIHVDARVRGDDVVAGLESLRSTKWGSPHEVRLTWAGRSEWVRILTVETQTTAGRGRTLTIAAQPTAPPSGRPAFIDHALSGRTPDESPRV